MSCLHENPAGYAFCVTCGEPLSVARCRCGFMCSTGDAYCGRCGNKLDNHPVAGNSPVQAGTDKDGRFDLARMLSQAHEEDKILETYRARVTQDDIRKLLAKRRRRSG